MKEDFRKNKKPKTLPTGGAFDFFNNLLYWRNLEGATVSAIKSPLFYPLLILFLTSSNSGIEFRPPSFSTDREAQAEADSIFFSMGKWLLKP